MNQILICFLLTFSLAVVAQTSPQQVIERINQSLLAIDKGEYRVDYKSKSLLETDTNTNAALVRYFKMDGGLTDTLARFVLWPSGSGLMQGSDGEIYFYVRKDSSIAIERVREKKGLTTYLTKGNAFRSRALSLPILTNRGHLPVNPEKWSTAKTGYFMLNDTAFVELYQRRMFALTMKITPTAKDSMIYIEQWLLYPDTYTPRRLREWADQQDGHVQFLEINFSAIKPLPPDAVFEMEYNTDKMIKNGYRITEISPNTRKNRVEMAIGDSIPDFQVHLETGDTLPLFSAFPQRYLVLDFWYRSCAPCNLAMPGLDRTAKALIGKDIAIVGVNPIDKQYDELIEQYKQQYQYSFPIAFTERAIADQLKITGYPQLLVVDQATHRVIHIQKGYAEEAEKSLLVFLETLLK